MRWADGLTMALTSLTRHKFRTALTMLGMIIGVAAVILLSGIGNGAKFQVTQSIESLGSNLIFINPSGGITFSANQVHYVQSATPMASAVVPVLTGHSHVTLGSTATKATVVGTVGTWFSLHATKWSSGQAWPQGSNHLALPEAVLGSTLASTLSPSGGLVGHHITVFGQRFLVAGVLAPVGQGLGSGQDTEIFVPLTTAQNWLGTNQISQIIVGTKSPTNASLATNLLTRLYQFRYQNSTAVQVGSEDQLLATLTQANQTFTDLLAGTALIALLVGGIGIMNIMLVSVRERTREIGVRMAVGAQREDVVLQFLLEAIGTSVTGGLAGMAVGLGSSGAVSHLLKVPVLIGSSSVMLAVGVSTLEGLVFGLYPSIAASHLDPIEALRYNG